MHATWTLRRGGLSLCGLLCRRGRVCRRLSLAAHSSDRSLRARRRRRLGGTGRREARRRDHRSADRDREPRRRRLDHRHRDGRRRRKPTATRCCSGNPGRSRSIPAVYKELRYDPVRDFAPITMTTAYPYILVVNAKLPTKSVQEFVALAKSKPGSTELRDDRDRRRQPSRHRAVQQQGRAQDDARPLSRHRARGRRLGRRAGEHGVRRSDQRAVAPAGGHAARTGGDQQGTLAVAPDVPTVAESGFPGFDAIAWHGILAPASTPPASSRSSTRRSSGRCITRRRRRCSPIRPCRPSATRRRSSPPSSSRTSRSGRRSRPKLMFR